MASRLSNGRGTTAMAAIAAAHGGAGDSPVCVGADARASCDGIDTDEGDREAGKTPLCCTGFTAPRLTAKLSFGLVRSRIMVLAKTEDLLSDNGGEWVEDFISLVLGEASSAILLCATMERRVRCGLGIREASKGKTEWERRSGVSDISESLSSEPALARAAALRRCHSLMV